MHRTTIRLDEDLLARTKELAAKTNRSLTGVIEDALRAAVAASRPGKNRRRIVLPTCGGEGLQPGVDLSNSAALLDLMDADDDPR
jgi:hypothetical protein